MALYKNVAPLVNTALTEQLGTIDIQLNEDLTNVVEFGKQIFSNDDENVDGFVKKLMNRIGIEIYVNRAYRGKFDKFIMRASEFGSVTSKVRSKLKDAEENPSMYLDPNKTYDGALKPEIPEVVQTFFNGFTNFQFKQTVYTVGLKDSFTNASSLQAFISMLYNDVEKSLTIALDNLLKRMVNSMTLLTMYKSDTTKDFSGVGDNRAINLLARYKVINPTSTLTANTCLFDKEFIRFASATIEKHINYLDEMSTLFNIGKQEVFTYEEDRMIILLNDFVSQANVYLNSDTFHDEYVKLPECTKISWWQGSGKSIDFTNQTTISAKIFDPTADLPTEIEVTATGVLGVVFDRECVTVSNYERHTTTDPYNGEGEFYNNYHKMKAGYLADINENFIVFYVKD